ncbi:MAG: hypothetical protein ACYCV5_09300 [Acidimicrobiales bacterium]
MSELVDDGSLPGDRVGAGAVVQAGPTPRVAATPPHERGLVEDVDPAPFHAVHSAPHPRPQPSLGATHPETPTTPRGPLEILRQWSRPLLIDVAARLSTLFVAFAVASTDRVGVGTLLDKWDGKWFLLAARSGYPSTIPTGVGNPAQSTLGFFPAFPLVIRGVAAGTGLSDEMAGLLAVYVLGLVASVLIWKLLADTVGQTGADVGTALVLFSPSAFVLGMVYSEALLVVCVAGCLLALRRHQWVTAGVMAAVASATDPLGAAVFVPCAIAAWVAIRDHRTWRSLAAPILAPVGITAFFVYLWVHVGTPLAYYIAQRRGWQSGTLGLGLISPFQYLFDHGFNDPNDTVKAASTLAVAVLLVAFLRRRPDGATVGYVVAALAIAAISPLISWTPRVALRAFPVLGLPVARLRHPWVLAVLVLSAVFMCVLTVLALGNGTIPFTP